MSELLSALVPKGGCEGYGITVWETFVKVVVSGFAFWKPLSLFVGLVHCDLDDSAVCIDGVGVFSSVVSFYMHYVVGEFLADEVLDDVHTVGGLGEEVFFSHFVPPFF